MDITTAPHWSFSSLSCYMRCPLQYAFRYIEGCETERTSVCLPFGRAFHAVMSERAAKGPRYQLEEAKEAFAEHFRSETEAADNLTYKPDEDFGACLSKGFDVLSVALAGWSDTEVIAVAERFSISIPGVQRPLVGEYDLIIRDEGEPMIVDWKTAASRWPANKADRDLQASAYCYAYHQQTGHNPTFRFDVVTKAKQPTFGRHYTGRSRDELERFERTVSCIERSVSAQIFYPVESVQNCTECPYRNRCRNWKG